MEQEVPIYAPFFGVMGAAAAIIFSGKCVCILHRDTHTWKKLKYVYRCSVYDCIRIYEKKFLSDICRQKIIDFCGIRREKMIKTWEFFSELTKKVLIDNIYVVMSIFLWPKITRSSQNIVMKNDSQYCWSPDLICNFLFILHIFASQKPINYQLMWVFYWIICKKIWKNIKFLGKWAFCKIMVIISRHTLRLVERQPESERQFSSRLTHHQYECDMICYQNPCQIYRIYPQNKQMLHLKYAVMWPVC